jgi:hypothetical protein
MCARVTPRVVRSDMQFTHPNVGVSSPTLLESAERYSDGFLDRHAGLQS